MAAGNGYDASVAERPWGQRILSARTVFLFVGLMLVALVYHNSWYFPLDTDQAQNLELGRSLADHFCYCTMSAPPIVFPAAESSNGPLEYVGGFFFKISHDNADVARVGAETVAAVILVVGLYAFEPWLVVVAFVLFFIWRMVTNLSVEFYGEIWAIGFATLGLAFLKRMEFTSGPLQLLRNKRFLAACVCFGFAMESKLVAAATITTLVFAVAYGRQTSRGFSEILLRLTRAIIASAMFTIGGFIVLFVSIAFSVAHSTHPLDVRAVFQTPMDFFSNMLLQGTSKSDPVLFGHLVARINGFIYPSFLVLPLLAAIVLVYANWAYVPLLAISLLTWLKIGEDEKHIVIAFYLIIVMGALEAQGLVRRFADRRGINLPTANALAGAVGLVIVCCIGAWPWVLIAVDSGPPPNQQFMDTTAGALFYSPKLIDMIRQQTYVATSGFWNFPDLMVRTDLHFYDRTDPRTTQLPKGKVALLFDEGNRASPITSVKENCGSIIYKEGSLVLCHVRADRDTDAQTATVPNPSLPTKGPNLLVNASFSQGPKGWAEGAGLRTAYLKPGGGGVTVSLNNVKGAEQITQDLLAKPNEPLAVSGVITIAGAPLPRDAGAEVYLLSTVDGKSAATGVNAFNDVGSYPFAFEFAPEHSTVRLLLFVFTGQNTNDKTSISFQNLHVAYLKKSVSVKP